MTFKLYTHQELSAERYHSDEFPQVSGSILAAIHETCPAEWRYGEKKQSTAMQFGTASHAALLEQDRFEAEFIRGIDPAEYPSALDTNKSMEAWLKERGRKCSGMDKAALIDAIDATGEKPIILSRLIEDHAALAAETGATIVPTKDYDIIVKMRDALRRNDRDDILMGGQSEVSIIGEQVKCRIDYINFKCNRPHIIDYKSTINVKDEAFGAQAFKLNYWLKMALQHDIFEQHYRESPKVILYAQSKKPPYLSKPFYMTEEQLQIGREQYQAAMGLYLRCVDADVWPDYGGLSELYTPPWVARQFGIDDSFEVVEDDSDE